MLDLANRNLKDFENQLQALIAKLQADGESAESVQTKTTEARNQCEIQRLAISQIAAEIDRSNKTSRNLSKSWLRLNPNGSQSN